jgi:hypothetical protein
MTTRVEVSPALLTWARQRSGLTVDDLYPRFPKLPAWEHGEQFPTLKQLENYALATQAAEATVSHLRTLRGDHEVGLIIECDGGVLAMEVKLGQVPDDRDVRHLHWLKREIGDRLLDSVVVTSGPVAYRRSDGIAVVPAALLGPL